MPSSSFPRVPAGHVVRQQRPSRRAVPHPGSLGEQRPHLERHPRRSASARSDRPRRHRHQSRKHVMADEQYELLAARIEPFIPVKAVCPTHHARDGNVGDEEPAPVGEPSSAPRGGLRPAGQAAAGPAARMSGCGSSLRALTLTIVGLGPVRRSMRAGFPRPRGPLLAGSLSRCTEAIASQGAANAVDADVAFGGDVGDEVSFDEAVDERVSTECRLGGPAGGVGTDVTGWRRPAELSGSEPGIPPGVSHPCSLTRPFDRTPPRRTNHDIH